MHWIARPLEQLMDKTRRAGKGDFSQPVQLRGQDELAELGRALNDMCEQLSSQQARIQAETTKRLAAMEQLRHADRLKTVGRLAAGIAHEMGTPLNVVSGRAGLIASGRLSVEEMRESALSIKNEADRITGIIRQLLDFARQRTPRRTATDVPELLAHTFELLKPLAEKRHVALRLDVRRAPSAIPVDPGQIQQVVTNILVNAVQSMPHGGEVSVVLDEQGRRPADAPQSPQGNYLAIAIRDQGVGIPPEHLEHVFEPFFTTKEVGEGTGLGLSIAYGIVQDHGGWIEVASEVGKGSCFTVYLPTEH
jgi:signal transduction histidine kinase